MNRNGRQPIAPDMKTMLILTRAVTAGHILKGWAALAVDGPMSKVGQSQGTLNNTFC
jgi:hypothetical protein